MKTIAIAILALISLCVLAQAQDIQPQQIPVQYISSVLPNGWFIESVDPAPTVSGWNKLLGSRGIRITISRHPYDFSLEPTKAGELSVYIPRVALYIFPSDFEGKHIDNSSIFREGKIIPSDKTTFAHHGMQIMDKFTQIGPWYIFHNDPSFPDWKNPVADITKAMRNVPNQGVERTLNPQMGSTSAPPLTLSAG